MKNQPQTPTLIILNPVANSGKMARYRALAHSRAQQNSNIEYIETTKRGDAESLAYDAAFHGKSIVTIGGDGTLNEVINGMLKTTEQVPLGIVAAGSGNDFARYSLGLPYSAEAAIERALFGQVSYFDAGRVNGRYFANSFSVGLDAEITLATEEMKRIPFLSGFMLYYTATLRTLFFNYRHCPWMSITLGDSKNPQKRFMRYVLIAITNGPTYGSGFRINPDANNADGEFDICLIKYIPFLQALKILPKIQQGTHKGQQGISFRRGQHIIIEGRQPLHAQLDGETMQSQSFDVTMLPQALAVRI